MHKKSNSEETEEDEESVNKDLEAHLIEDVTDNQGVYYSSFKFLEELGAGTFGKVFKVLKNESNEIYAMKILSKKKLINDFQLKYALTECNVLKKASKHPFIVTLHYAFQVFI